MSRHILIVDDEDDIRSLIKGILEDEGYETSEAANAAQALELVEQKSPDLIILDIWLQDSDQDGLEILKTVKEKNSILPVLMISGHGTIETAVSSIKEGAYDFIEKPFKSDRLLLMVSRALETAALKQENQALKAQKNTKDDQLIGRSAGINQIRQQLERIAPTNSRVLITGEGGTGKEVVARTIHNMSERKNEPFMVINCAGLRPESLEEELFGVDLDGRTQKGLLELSHGGTLFLDEVADMPLEIQGKILRVLQDHEIHPVGSSKQISVDVRILASTNRNLEKAIQEGKFREDLFYRLNVVTLTTPPLRKRPEDIAPIAEFFLSFFAEQTGQEKKTLDQKAKIALESYSWPGNVRQLKNIMEWITIMLPASGDNGEIRIDDLPPEITGTKKTSINSQPLTEFASKPLREAREVFEREYLTIQIKRFKGNVSQTAEFIGMERSALHRKLKALDISLSDEQDSRDSGSPPERKTA